MVPISRPSFFLICCSSTIYPPPLFCALQPLGLRAKAVLSRSVARIKGGQRLELDVDLAEGRGL